MLLMHLTICLLVALSGVVFADQSRDAVELYIVQAFGHDIAQELLKSYDAGKFIPKTSLERGIEGEYVVQWRPECSQRPSCLQQLRHEHLDVVRMTVLHDVPGAALVSLLHDRSGCVKVVEQDHVIKLPENEETPLDSRRLQEVPALPWGIDFLDGRFTGTYDPGYTGRGVDVYVLDTGVDSNHPWLSVGGGKGFSNERDTMDRHGHGTHCAGTIAGRYVGVAQSCMIRAVKVLGDDGTGRTSWTIQGLDWVVSEKERIGGPAVASMSLGGPYFPLTNAAVVVATRAGVVVVVAAGNENQDARYTSPCSEPESICVGALAMDPGGGTFSAATYSNYGDRLDIWAPGTDILSLRTTYRGGGTMVLSGTSMACPHVTGVVAQILEWKANASVAEVTRMLDQECSQNHGASEIKVSTSNVIWTKATQSTSANGPCRDGLDEDLVGGQLGLLSSLVSVCLCFACCGFCAYVCSSSTPSSRRPGQGAGHPPGQELVRFGGGVPAYAQPAMPVNQQQMYIQPQAAITPGLVQQQQQQAWSQMMPDQQQQAWAAHMQQQQQLQQLQQQTGAIPQQQQQQFMTIQQPQQAAFQPQAQQAMYFQSQP